MSRIIIFTGKGGVGKSSVAAAHAVKSAQEGARTLLVSTDMAHNIADIFQKPVGSHVTQLAEHLYGLELDPDLMMREEFPEMNRSIAKMFTEAGFAADKMGSDTIFPGFDDLFSLLKIAKLHESGDFDRIIVDCAPTGETLSLLKLPELLAWYMEKFFPVGKMMVRVLSPISKYKYHVDLPSMEGMDDISKMHQRLMQLQELLKDDRICSVRLVCTPEKMVVEETKRNYMYLNLYGYQVDGLYINRVLPEDVDNAFFQRWKDIQGRYLEELAAVFGGISTVRIPWFSGEVRGAEMVSNFADCLCAKGKEKELFSLKGEGEKETYEETKDGYLLTLSIPGVKREELRVDSKGMDIDISLHNFQRRIPLPNVLRTYRVSRVTVEEDRVKIHFAAEDL